jgi:hypothetical protein
MLIKTLRAFGVVAHPTIFICGRRAIAVLPRRELAPVNGFSEELADSLRDMRTGSNPVSRS